MLLEIKKLNGRFEPDKVKDGEATDEKPEEERLGLTSWGQTRMPKGTTAWAIQQRLENLLAVAK